MKVMSKQELITTLLAIVDSIEKDSSMEGHFSYCVLSDESKSLEFEVTMTRWVGKSNLQSGMLAI